jgi:cellulose biosynthesis protein BcsQ
MRGGVGRMTLTVSLAMCPRRLHGRRVLLVDLDPQFNQYLMRWSEYSKYLKDAARHTILHVFKGVGSPALGVVHEPAEYGGDVPLRSVTAGICRRDPAGLDLIPSILEMMFLDTVAARLGESPVSVHGTREDNYDHA